MRRLFEGFVKSNKYGSISARGEGGGVCAAGLSEPLPYYSLFCG